MDYSFSVLRREISSVLKMSMAIVTGAFSESKKKIELTGKEKYDQFTGKITELIDKGMINEAENIMLDAFDKESISEIKCLEIYKYLNEKSDSFLERHDYTREEILYGIKLVMEKRFGSLNILC